MAAYVLFLLYMKGRGRRKQSASRTALLRQGKAKNVGAWHTSVQFSSRPNALETDKYVDMH